MANDPLGNMLELRNRLSEMAEKSHALIEESSALIRETQELLERTPTIDGSALPDHEDKHKGLL